MPHWNKVAILGVGLIGGSIGMAMRDRKLAKEVIGIGRSAAKLKEAKKLGAITSISLDLESAVADADLVVVCTPVADIAKHAIASAQAAPDRALITDAGSTKASIVADVEKSLKPSKHFVGSHPLAGSEKCGAAFARADLFEGRVTIVTPSRRTRDEDSQAIADFWSSLGSTVFLMSPEVHDKALAATSHFPHLIASAVAGMTNVADLPLTAGGWRDLTRIAAGDPELWTQILLDNRRHVLKSLAGFEKTLKAYRAALERADRRRLLRLLTEGKQVRDALGN